MNPRTKINIILGVATLIALIFSVMYFYDTLVGRHSDLPLFFKGFLPLTIGGIMTVVLLYMPMRIGMGKSVLPLGSYPKPEPIISIKQAAVLLAVFFISIGTFSTIMEYNSAVNKSFWSIAFAILKGEVVVYGIFLLMMGIGRVLKNKIAPHEDFSIA